jgi:hypothetical protein
MKIIQKAKPNPAENLRFADFFRHCLQALFAGTVSILQKLQQKLQVFRKTQSDFEPNTIFLALPKSIPLSILQHNALKLFKMIVPQASF